MSQKKNPYTYDEALTVMKGLNYQATIVVLQRQRELEDRNIADRKRLDDCRQELRLWKRLAEVRGFLGARGIDGKPPTRALTEELFDLLVALKIPPSQWWRENLTRGMG